MDDYEFTPQQRRIAKRIAKAIAELRKSGCVVLGKAGYLFAYDNKHYKYSTEEVGETGVSLPVLDCGRIDDSGADDELYFTSDYPNL